MTLELKWPEHPVYPEPRLRGAARATSTRWSPSTPWTPGPRCARAPRPSPPSCGRPGHRRRRQGQGHRPDRGDPRPLRGDRRRRQLPLRPGPGHRPGPQLPPGHGHPRLLREPDAATTPWIESALDMRDRNGNSLPGYGWIFPVGDGDDQRRRRPAVDLPGLQSVNTTHLLEEFAATAPDYWGISPRDATSVPTGGRLPMGGSVDAQGRPDLDRRRRRRRIDQPVQRRGHRLRLRDRPHGRRPARRVPRTGDGMVAAALPGACSTTSTASTSRWPASSPR